MKTITIWNQQILSQFKTKQTDNNTIIATQKITQLRILRALSERFRAFLNSNERGGKKKKKNLLGFALLR